MMLAQATEQQSAYLGAFARFAREIEIGNGAAWIHQVRRDAMESFAELGFPNTHMEEWRFTNVNPIARTFFEVAGDRAAPALAGALDKLALRDTDCHRLVFVNGRYHPELSSRKALPGKVTASSLAAVLPGRATVEQNLARHASYKDHAFVALNTAFLKDGAFVNVPAGVVVDTPVHLVYLSAPGEQPWVSHPRNLVIAGRGSQLTVIESYIGSGDGVYFTNAVTEIVAGRRRSRQSLQSPTGKRTGFSYGHRAGGPAARRNLLIAVHIAGRGAGAQ